MNRRLALTIAVVALASARRAAAQEVAIGYQGLPYKAPGESKTGINLAEGVLLHVGAGAEAGWDSNVFYGSTSPGGTGETSSYIYRLSVFGELTNATRNGAQSQAGISYDVRAGLVYRRYTSQAVEAYRDAFMPTAGLSLGTSYAGWTFQLSDTFLRQEDPPYQGGGGASPITRDNNLASIQAQWSPGGGRITGTLRYTNTIDVFEQSSGFAYASTLSHGLMADVSWKWLPKTAIFIEATQGYITYLNSQEAAADNKVSSYPLRVYAGLRGLITPKLTATAALGYVNGFYSSGATTGGILGSTYVDLQAVITPSLLNRFTVGYHQDFQNSVVSNFYYDYSVYGSYVQQLAGRMAVDLSARLSHRDYQGLDFDTTGATRTDNLLIAGATLDYFIHTWAYCGLGYSLTSNFTSYRLPPKTDPVTGAVTPGAPVDYVKHQVFARLGITY